MEINVPLGGKYLWDAVAGVQKYVLRDLACYYRYGIGVAMNERNLSLSITVLL